MKLLELLNVETGASVSTLARVIETAPKRYKVYEIPKKTGGTRQIAHPAKELKAIQRIVLKELLDSAPISRVASAYVKNRGILYNAVQHAGQRWVLKLDFRDFFHSITPDDWNRTVRRVDSLAPLASEKYYLNKILFWGRGTTTPQCLSIGAPTSPMISNLVCHKLDDWLEAKAGERGLVVTRYADDITVSGSNVHQISRFEKDLERLLERSSGLRLELNSQKRGLYGPGERRMVTGLVLTPEGKISIGRERKREIHSLVHKFGDLYT